MGDKSTALSPFSKLCHGKKWFGLFWKTDLLLQLFPSIQFKALTYHVQKSHQMCVKFWMVQIVNDNTSSISLLSYIYHLSIIIYHYLIFSLSLIRVNINLQCNMYSEFETIYSTILDGHAAFKKKIIRGNKKPHCSRDLRKAIMKRS